MRRTTNAMLALSATAMLLAGCGSSTSTSSSNAPALVQTPISSAQAGAFADAVNLRAADVQGLQAARRKPRAETANGPFGAAMDRCQGAAVRSRKVSAISSQRFVHLSLPLQSVGSGVYYFKNEALAREYLTVAHSPRFAACVKALAAKQPKTVRSEGSKVAQPMFSQPRLSALSVSLPGVQTYGLRLATRFTGGGGAESYTDFLSFVKGAAVITLTSVGQGDPFPVGSQQRLLALLYSRAQAHKL